MELEKYLPDIAVAAALAWGSGLLALFLAAAALLVRLIWRGLCRLTGR